MEIYSVSTNIMDLKEEQSSLVVNEVRQGSAMFLGAPEPCDSGFDSDDDALARQRRVPDQQRISDSSGGEEDYEMYEQLARGDQLQENKDEVNALIEWRKSALLECGEMSDGSDDRSSPPFCVFELSPSDEDDDASVLELVIPMQSRYKRVPTSSPKKMPRKSPSLLSHLFCCFRK